MKFLLDNFMILSLAIKYVNESKTKYMEVWWKSINNNEFTTDEYIFGHVEVFTYLGTELTTKPTR